MKMADPFWQNSMCKNSYLHRFNIVEQYEEGVLEVCEICFKRKFFKVLDGKVDNVEYMSFHLKQSLPAHHPLYERQQLQEGVLGPYL